ncbi:hypothetical protein JW835_01735 [bacterium]|nr:hypothetical protein [bacterium]
MTISEICILIGGVLTLLMGFFHTRFYKLFLWERDFTKITGQNRRILYTIHIALLLLFFGLGAVSLWYYQVLARAQHLAQGLLFMLVIFWFWRALWQIIYFKPSRNRRLEKYFWMHYILMVCFLSLCVLYLIPIVLA